MRAAGIRETIDKLQKHLAQGAYDYEILVVDDKSSDNTVDAVKSAGLTPVCLPQNRGKGGAVKRGVKAATGDVIIFTDADLPYDLSLIEESIVHIGQGADLAIGSREGTGYEAYGSCAVLAPLHFPLSQICFCTSESMIRNAALKHFPPAPRI